jgi:hypothetical protein
MPTMEQVDRQLVDDGLRSAEDRTSRELKVSNQRVSPQARDALHRTFHEWPRQLNRRFIRDFAETVGIADISRRHFEHKDLTEKEIHDFLGKTEEFVNSWSHP